MVEVGDESKRNSSRGQDASLFEGVVRLYTAQAFPWKEEGERISMASIVDRPR